MTIKFRRPLYVSPIYMFGIIFILLISYSSASAANDNPFETNPKIHDYARKFIQAVEAKDPLYLKIVQIDEKEMEDVYQHLRVHLDHPLDIWKLVLLDYPRLRLLRNAIYARHGKSFSSEDLDRYFRSFTWYKPNPKYSDTMLSQIENNNLSALTRIEFLKYHSHEKFIQKPDLSHKKGEDFTGENELIKVTNKEVFFKQSRIKIPLAHAEKKYLKATVFVERNVPVVVIRYWRPDIYPSGQFFADGVDVYDIQGKKLNSFPGGSEIFYSPDIKAFILSTFDGGGGSSWGSSIIFNAEGEVLFSSEFGYDGGQGSIEYIYPLWGKNLIAWISGEVRKEPETYDRIAIFSQSGEQIINIKINTDSLPMSDSQGQGLRQLVLLAPDLLYVYSHRSHDAEQSLVFLKKSLAFKPTIGKLYTWRPVRFSSPAQFYIDQLYVSYGNRESNVKISPVRNPATLWTKEVYFGGFDPIVTKDQIIFTMPQEEMRDLWQTGYGLKGYLKMKFNIIAVDKLTGKQLWSYQTPALLEAISSKENILALKFYTGLVLLDSNTGKTLWATPVDSTIYQYPEHANLLIGENYLILASSKLFIDVYDLRKGNLIKRMDVRSLNPKIGNSGYPNWFSTHDSAIVSLNWSEGEGLKGKAYLLLVAMDFQGNLRWSYTVPFKKDQRGIYDMFSLKVAIDKGKVFIHDDEGEGFYLDPLTGETTGNRVNWQDKVKISWYRGDIRQYDRNFNDEIKKKKSSEKISYPCTPSFLHDNVIYAWDSYHSLTTIVLLDSCLTEIIVDGTNYAHRESYWTYAPWQKIWKKTHEEQNPKIIFLDNNFILVKVSIKQLNGLQKISYWALGDVALRDYAMRINGDVYKEIEMMSKEDVK